MSPLFLALSACPTLWLPLFPFSSLLSRAASMSLARSLARSQLAPPFLLAAVFLNGDADTVRAISVFVFVCLCVCVCVFVFARARYA